MIDFVSCWFTTPGVICFELFGQGFLQVRK
jgi:hypothetical protein